MVLEPLTGRNTTGCRLARGSGGSRHRGRRGGANAPGATAYRDLANDSRGTSARPSGFQP